MSDTLRNELGKALIRTTLIAASTKADTVDPDGIADLLERHFGVDDGRVVAVDERGAPISRGGQPVTADTVVREFLARRPHWRKA